MVRYLKRLKSSRLGRVQAFPMYGGLGMSAPSLHRESTDSLINYLDLGTTCFKPAMHALAVYQLRSVGSYFSQLALGSAAHPLLTVAMIPSARRKPATGTAAK